jgi:hypothetical protein
MNAAELEGKVDLLFETVLAQAGEIAAMRRDHVVLREGYDQLRADLVVLLDEVIARLG